MTSKIADIFVESYIKMEVGKRANLKILFNNLSFNIAYSRFII